MAEWVHCNVCINRYRSTTKFYVTSCGHMICQNCLLKTGIDNQCPQCKSETELVEICSNMDVNIEAFFRPLSEMLGKSVQISSFQLSNTCSLIKGILNKYNMAKAEVIKCRMSTKELKTEINKLTTELRNATTKVAKLTTENNNLNQQLKLKELNKSQFSNPAPKYESNNSSRTTNTTLSKRNLPPYHFASPSNYMAKPPLWSGPMSRGNINLSNRSQDVSVNSISLRSDGSSIQTPIQRGSLNMLPMVHLNLGTRPNSRFHP